MADFESLNKVAQVKSEELSEKKRKEQEVENRRRNAIVRSLFSSLSPYVERLAEDVLQCNGARRETRVPATEIPAELQCYIKFKVGGTSEPFDPVEEVQTIFQEKLPAFEVWISREKESGLLKYKYYARISMEVRK